MKKLSLMFCSKKFSEELTIEVSKAVIAGWTGSDREAVEAHIVELEELGVKRPATVPTYYPVAVSNLTTDHSVEVLGGESSGEVEFVLLKALGEIWIGLGSDHTDRQLEAHDVAFSKQVCTKPMANTVWLLSELLEHWDELTLQSFIEEGGMRQLYQKGSVAALLHPVTLMERYTELTGKEFVDGMVMFGGTFPAIGGIRPSFRLELRLHDPVLDREIAHFYEAQEI